MKKKLLTKEQKIANAIELAEFFKEIGDPKNTKIYWENVWQRAVWILEDASKPKQ